MQIGNDTNIFLVKNFDFIAFWQTLNPSHPAKCSFNYSTNRLNFKFLFYLRRNINLYILKNLKSFFKSISVSLISTNSNKCGITIYLLLVILVLLFSIDYPSYHLYFSSFFNYTIFISWKQVLILDKHGNQFLITICNKESKSSKQSSIMLDIGFLDSDSDL